MRHGFKPLSAFVVLLALAGCPPREEAPARPSEEAPAAPAVKQEVKEVPPAAPRDAGPAPEAEAAPDPALEGNLQTFRGFSGDESRFAFSVYSEGAGFHLLHVVQGQDGKVLERFQLVDEPNTKKARAFLKAHRYSSKLAAAPAGLGAKVKGGEVVVTDAAGKVLYRGDPFGAQEGMGGPASAEVAGVSPSGKKAAVKVEQVPVTEFGGITTYLLVDLEGAR